MTRPLMPVDRIVEFTVYGDPAPQGSKTANYRKGPGGIPVPTGKFHESGGDRLQRWRDAVKAGAFMQSRGRVIFTAPVFVALVVTVPRPSAKGRSPWRHAAWPGGDPDTDKLQRAVGDALKDGRVIEDDALIVLWENPCKVFPGSAWPHALDRPGAWIRVREAE